MVTGGRGDGSGVATIAEIATAGAAAAEWQWRGGGQVAASKATASIVATRAAQHQRAAGSSDYCDGSGSSGNGE